MDKKSYVLFGREIDCRYHVKCIEHTHHHTFYAGLAWYPGNIMLYVHQ